MKVIKMLKQKLLNEINQVPENQLDELYNLILKFKSKHRRLQTKKKFKNLLLKAPVWNEAEEQNIAELRRMMDSWKPPQYS